MTPQQESTSVQRRALDFEDYVDIIRRHRTAILGPAFAALVIAVVTAYMWPDTYVSQAVIRVVPPQVPEQLVPTNVNVEMGQHIQAMAQQILSRNSLTNIVQTQNLYPAERKRKPLEDIIDRMQGHDIRIGQVQSITAGGGARVPAFSIAFSYSERIVAQKVCQDLVSRFIDENIRSRSSQSLMTTEFLREQTAAAKAKLEEMDKRMAEFRSRNAGQLPEEFSTNLQQHYAVENRINTLNSSINRVNQEKVMLESQYRGLRDQLTALTAPRSSSSSGSSPQLQQDPEVTKLQAEIDQLESALGDLRQRYTETYPDVKRVESLLKLRRQRMAELTHSQPDSASSVDKQADAIVSTRGLSPDAAREVQDVQTQLSSLRGAIDAKDLELSDYQRQIKEANATLLQLEQRMRDTPGQPARILADDAGPGGRGKPVFGAFAEDVAIRVGQRPGESAPGRNPGSNRPALAASGTHRSRPRFNHHSRHHSRVWIGVRSGGDAGIQRYHGEESEGRSGVHQADRARKYSAARKRPGGQTSPPGRLAGVDRGLYARNTHHVGLGVLLLFHPGLEGSVPA